MSGMSVEPTVMAFCPACGGNGARHMPLAALSTQEPGRLIETSRLVGCNHCRAHGTFPMPGRLIVGSLRGLLDGPEPGLA